MKSKRFVPSLLCFIAAFLIAHYTVVAQISLSYIASPALQITQDDFWNFNIFNASTSDMEAKISLEVKRGNSSIFTCTINSIQLHNGNNNLNKGSIQSYAPAYTYFNVPTFENVQYGGRFPFGNYNVCLKVYISNVEEATDCFLQEVNPLSPPVLVIPFDKAEIEHTLFPILSWLPPSPVLPDMNLNYHLKLVEIVNNQTPYDALKRNLPILEKKGISYTNMIYPADAFPLAYGKNYAWQIAAYNGTELLGETEVWSFKLVPPSTPEPDSHPTIYSRTKPSLDGSFIEASQTLYFTYDEDYKSSSLDFKITSLQGKDLKLDEAVLKNVGENRYELSITGLKGLAANQYYILEIYSTKQEKQYLLFKYKK